MLYRPIQIPSMSLMAFITFYSNRYASTVYYLVIALGEMDAIRPVLNVPLPPKAPQPVLIGEPSQLQLAWEGALSEQRGH